MDDLHRSVELIENKEIRGLSYKTGLAILISTLTTVVAIVSIYFLLKGDIATINLNKAKDDKYNDLRMSIMEANLQDLKNRLDRMSIEVNTNTESRIKK